MKTTGIETVMNITEETHQNITVKSWNIGGGIIRHKLLEILGKIWLENNIPIEWPEGILAPTHKNSSREIILNYRGVSLMDAWYKTYTDILRVMAIIKTNNIYTVEAVYTFKNEIQNWIDEKEMEILGENI